MINLHTGKVVALITGGKYDKKKVYIDPDYDDGVEEMICTDESTIMPKIDKCSERCIWYICGPSGSGKSTYAAQLIKDFSKEYPKSTIYIISRTDYKNDPAYKNLKMIQVPATEALLEHRIDIEKDIRPDSLMVFDDFNTIPDKLVREYIQHLICDIMETGRKLRINCILTNHLIIPNEKSFARTLLNEIQNLTVFPKSGSSHAINYVLKTYFGMSRKEIKEILKLKSRWVSINRTYPMNVIYNKGVYII